MKFFAIFLSLISFIIFTPVSSSALSKYGSSCDLNDDCKKCRSDGSKCQICMNGCYNKFGDAEATEFPCKEDDKWCLLKHRCIIKQAKWCNAQCWDPDDKTQKDYVSTKPNCDKYKTEKKRKKRD